jgi:hypothetical protein
VEKGEGFIMQKTEAITSLLLILMGTIDCITTIIGVSYSGASELNPVLAGIVSTNIGGFLILKIAATAIIAFTYLFANRIIMKTENKATRSFKFSYRCIKVSYVGILAFMVIVVANNLIILLA